MRGTILPITLKSGQIRYQTVIRHEGRQIWKRFDRRRDAERYLDSISADIRSGAYKKIDRDLVFSDYAHFWRNNCLSPKDYKPSTIHSYLSILDTHLLSYFGKKTLVSIDQASYRAFETSLGVGDRGKKTVKNAMILLGKIMKDAVEDGYLVKYPFNPPRRKGSGKTTKKQMGRALTAAEINRLLDCCDRPLTRLAVMTAILSGLRRGEQFGLQWSDVDFRHDLIHVKKEIFWITSRYADKGSPRYVLQSPKTPSSIRRVDLSPTLKKALQEYFLQAEHKDAFVFAHPNGEPLYPDAFVRRHFRPAARSAGLEPLRWHDLRHTYGSLKLETGCNIKYIMSQMGHSKVSVTLDIYSHLLQENNPLAAQKTDEFIFGKKSC